MLKRDAYAGGDVVRYRMARLLLSRPVIIGSCYRIGDLLVDAGPPNNRDELLASLKGEPIRTILVTHGHEDHAGNVALFPRADVRGAPGLRIARGIPFYRRVAWGEPVAGGSVAPVGSGLDVDDLSFKAIPTPGHTPDHLAYFEPDRGWLFAGDAVLGPVKYAMEGEDTLTYIASLKKMRDLKPAMVFPSHGPVLDKPQEQLAVQIARLEGLRGEARRLTREGLGEAAITRRLLGYNGLMGTFSGGEFSKRRLVRNLLGERP